MKTLTRTFHPKTVQKSYANVAWFYNFWSRLTESKAAKRVIDLAEIKDGEKCVEVAVGTGLVFRKIVRKNPSGQNIGIDLSPDMLERAKKLLNKLENVNFELETGNAYELPFEADSFDLLINNYMLDLIPKKDFDTILAEFYRVLKPGGRAVIANFGFGDQPYHKIWYWLAKFFPALLTGCRPVSITRHLKNVGFEIEKAELVSQNTFPSEVIRAKK